MAACINTGEKYFVTATATDEKNCPFMKKIASLVFGLMVAFAAKTQDYQTIHEQAVVCDTHNDIISVTIDKGYLFDTDLTGKTHSDLGRMKKGGLDVQVFSVFCDGLQDHPYRFANREIDSLYEWVRRNPSKMMLVTTPLQLREAVEQHKLGAMLGVEGGHMIEDDLGRLDSLYKRGVRYMTLTHNNNTSWATSAQNESDTAQHLSHKGLTDFGKQVVKEMNALGMMVDLSHVGEQTFWDAIHTTTKPVLVSHSNAYTLCPVFRNLKDDQIKAVAKNGGVIQLNFYSRFLDSSVARKQDAFLLKHKAEKDAMIASGIKENFAEDAIYEKYPAEVAELQAPFHFLLDHLDYIIKLAGVDCVGLGGDFDGIPFTPLELTDVTKYPLITKALLSRGYSKKDIVKILGGNFIRVFTANTTR
jgi:membrane dipeptidase